MPNDKSFSYMVFGIMKGSKFGVHNAKFLFNHWKTGYNAGSFKALHNLKLFGRISIENLEFQYEDEPLLSLVFKKKKQIERRHNLQLICNFWTILWLKCSFFGGGGSVHSQT